MELIALFYQIDMMSMADHVFMDVETPRICSECSLEKEFIDYDTKDILRMNDKILIMT